MSLVVDVHNHTIEANIALLYNVDKTTGRCNKQMTAEAQFVNLIAVILASAVQNRRCDRCAIGEFARFVIDL